MASAVWQLALLVALPTSQAPYDFQFESQALMKKGMSEMGAYSLLRRLTSEVGTRLSGSEGDRKAIAWSAETMRRLGLQNVRTMPCKVPHWVRGSEEWCRITGTDGKTSALTGTALGGSVGTDSAGVSASVVEVGSLEDCVRLGKWVQGKIVFFNGRMRPENLRTFASYGEAVAQRSRGASTAAKLGAVGVVIRSVTTSDDDVPHTGAMRYEEGVAKIPAMALGAASADRLNRSLKTDPALKLSFRLSCETLPDADSANVIGEIVGSEKPNEIVLLGAHLDSWDKGTGAHDDGAGVVHVLDAMRLIRELEWKPKRTIRAVLFANEENGGRGAQAYLAFARSSKERHLAAMESDAGGFAPRAVNVSFDTRKMGAFKPWHRAMAQFGIDRWEPGGSGGADVAPLRAVGAVLFGLEPESQRYFDVHHSDNDVLTAVHPRELQLGALTLAMTAWMISERGVPR